MVFGWGLSQARVNPHRYSCNCVPKISPGGGQTFSGRRHPHQRQKINGYVQLFAGEVRFLEGKNVTSVAMGRGGGQVGRLGLPTHQPLIGDSLR